MGKIKNIIFDFDMTLGYRTTMWTDTVKELLLKNNVFATSEQIRPVTHGPVYPWSNPSLSHEEFFKGRGWWETVCSNIGQGLVENGICDEDTAKKVCDEFPSLFCDKRFWKLFPDTLQTLSFLRDSGYNLFLLSNHIPEAREIFCYLGLDRYFKKMIISSEEDCEKPSPVLFDKICDGEKADKFVMIGDNYFSDVLGAQVYGMNAVMVRKPNVTSYKYYCRTLYEVPAILEKIK